VTITKIGQSYRHVFFTCVIDIVVANNVKTLFPP
jgi:hypothetical protein